VTERIEYHSVDKSNWLDGPWKGEPDKLQWQDEVTGLPCLIVRGPSGALCGYVGLPPGHKLHGEGYDNVDVNVHGGLTFASSCSHGEQSHSICHVPSEGESDDVWWLGFDCAHCGDYTPVTAAMLGRRYVPGGSEQYRDLAYVQEQVGELARQLWEVR
jgi:hypothetical protein